MRGQNSPFSLKLQSTFQWTRCPKCGYRIWKTKLHNCRKAKTNVHLVFGRRKCKASDFLKIEYLNKNVKLDYTNRTELVRFFMNVFKPNLIITQGKVCRIRIWLSRLHLTNAEIHAILFHLGFRYKTLPNCAQTKSSHLTNIRINGYFDNQFPKKRLFVDVPTK